MYGRLNRNMGFSLIIFAFFFLFEPSLGLIDPLPDVVGYTILSLALINLADINGRIMTALKGFLKLILVSVLKIVSSVILGNLFSAEEQPMGSLIVTFVFAFFELAILLPSYKALFEGLLALGIFHDGEAVYKKRRERGRNRTEKLYSLTLAFVILKTVVCALPEFSTLQNNSSYEFITIARILAIICVTPISVSWLVSAVSYFISVKRDVGFVESLTQKYTEQKEAQPEMYLFRPLSVALTLCLVASVLSFDIYSGDINYLPDAPFFALIILSAIILRREFNQWGTLTALSSIGALSALFLFFVEREFFTRHYISAIKRDLEAYDHYYFMLVVYILQAIIAIAVTVLLAFLLKSTFDNHVLHDGVGKDEGKRLSGGLKIRSLLFILFGILSQLATVFHILALPYFSRGWIFEYSGIISSVVSIGFIACALALVEYIRAEMKSSYKLIY